jgi:hypothetical protein
VFSLAKRNATRPKPTYIKELDAVAAEQRKWDGGIDWSDCPCVQRDPAYLGGALAVRSSPRVLVEGLIVNYESGKIAAMFQLPENEVAVIIRYYQERTT